MIDYLDYYNRMKIEADVRKNFLEQMNLEKFIHITKTIEEKLKKEQITHEGKYNVTISPTILYKNEVVKVAADIQKIHHLLIKVIEKFREDYLSNNKQSPLVNFFLSYEKWFPIIAEENRILSPINHARFDMTFDVSKGWKIMEVNTRSPAGVIVTGKSRNAYLETHFPQEIIGNYQITNFPVDTPASFVLFLAEQAEKVSSNSNIAICTYQGVYTSELDMILVEFQKMPFSGKKLILCDAREIEEKNGIIYAKNIPVSLIYNKLDPYTIDPKDPSWKGWLAASRSQNCDFLNSLAAIYLTDTKRILSLLKDENLQQYLGFSNSDKILIDKYVPMTCRLNQCDLQKVIFDRDEYVLKPDNLCRGEGVHIGKEKSFLEWNQIVVNALNENMIVQNNLNHLTKPTFINHDGKLNQVIEYYGVDFFYFGGSFAGLWSRSHTSRVYNLYNLGSGGSLSPVLVLS